MARIRWRAAAFALLGIMFCAAAVTGAADEHLHDLRLASLAEHAALIRQRLAYPDDAGASNSPDEGIIEYLSTCTTPDARLFMMTFAPELLFYTRRGFAAGHESLVPGFYTHDRNASLMLERLSHEDVPFVIMDSETIDAIRANYPRLIRHVDGRYREVVRFPLAVGKDFIVFADATRTPAGSFGHRGLPCFAAAGARAVRAVTDP
jgi:hypothetical protein